MGIGLVSLILDTHALLWWLTDLPLFTREQHDAIESAEGSGEPLHIAAISLWELAKLAERRRIEFQGSIDMLFDEVEQHSRLQVVPLTPRVALESTRLGSTFHRDPADQMIAATARVHGYRLVTADERIRASGVVSVV